MAAENTPDPELIRNRTVYGWGAHGVTSETEIRIRSYLQDGNPEHLEGTRYPEERLKVVDRLTATERADLGLGPKQRPKKPKLQPAKQALLDQALSDEHAHVEVFDGRQQKLILAVDADNRVTFHMHCPPEEAVLFLMGLVQTIMEATGPDRGTPEHN